MTKPWMICVCVGLLAVLALGPGQVAAQHESDAEELENARRARQLTNEIMSPFCPNRTLAECPAQEAEIQRQRVRSWVDAGLSEQEIKARLDRELGPVLARNFSRDPNRPAYVPTLDPIPGGSASWLVPIAVLLVGAGGVGFLMLRLQRGATPKAQKSAAPLAGVSAKELREIEAELDAELEARGIGGRPPRA